MEIDAVEREREAESGLDSRENAGGGKHTALEQKS